MGRGHACRHASLLADLDTRHSKPFRGIGHPRIYAPTNQRQVTELCHCALEAGVSQAVVEKAVDAADAKGDLIGLVLARRASHIQGSLARSLCTIAHPLDTKFTNKVRDIFGAALSEAAVRPGPRSCSSRRGCRSSRPTPSAAIPDEDRLSFCTAIPRHLGDSP